MTPEELRSEIEAGRIDTVVMAFPDHYGRLMGKRFDGQFFLDSGLDHGTHACDYLFTVDMEMNPVSGYSYASWERGYGDFHMVPDLATIRPCGWTEGAAMVMCDAEDNTTHQPVAIAPRSVLRNQVDDALVQLNGSRTKSCDHGTDVGDGEISFGFCCRRVSLSSQGERPLFF